jgi:hypothetical protein
MPLDVVLDAAEIDRRAERRMRRYDNMSPERIDRRHVINTRLMLGDSASEAIRFARLRALEYGIDELPPPPYSEIRVTFDGRGGSRVTPILRMRPGSCDVTRRRPRPRQYRSRRVARRVARTSGSRGDPPHPGSDDDDPHDVAVALSGVAT